MINHDDELPELEDDVGVVAAANRRHQSWRDTMREWRVVVLLSYLGPLFAAYSCIIFPLSFESMGVLHGCLFYITEFVLGIDLLCHIFHIYPDWNRIISSHGWDTIIIPRCSIFQMFLEFLAIIQLQWFFQDYEIGKYLICIKVVRVFKVRGLFNKLERDLPIKYVYVNSFKLVILQCYLAHIASSAFYHVAVTFPPPTNDTWLKHLQLGDIGPTQKYIASFYFAIVTMYTVGYGDIHPVNAMEMMFTIGVIMMGLIASTYLIGQVSDLFESGDVKSELLIKLLKDYMEKNGLWGNRLTTQSILSIQQGDTKKGIAEDYPRHVRAMLFRPFIERVDLFGRCSHQLIDQIAEEVYEEFLLPGEVIIEGGTVVDQLYIFCNGLLEKLRGKFSIISEQQIRDCCCIGVESLFCNEIHYSTVQAVEPSRLLRLNKEALMRILSQNVLEVNTIQENLQRGELDLGLSITRHKTEQATKLNSAAYHGDEVALIRLLTVEGISVNNTDDYKRSPLHVAAETAGLKNIVWLLLDRGSEVNVKDFHGNTPFLEALNHGNDDTAQLLYHQGAIVEGDDAVEFLFGALLKENLDTIVRLMGTTQNLNTPNYNGHTLLHLAAARGDLPVVERLISAGAFVTPKDRWGERPIDAAKHRADEKIMKVLREAAHRDDTRYGIKHQSGKVRIVEALQ